jgi:hypothetical protein
MAKSSKFLTPETLRRKGKGGALLWNPEALDWPLRPMAEPEEIDEIRNLILKYLDDMAQGESGRTRREIRREMVRAFRRLYEIVVFFQKVFQRAEDVACGKRDFSTGKLVRPSRRKVVKKSRRR